MGALFRRCLDDDFSLDRLGYVYIYVLYDVHSNDSEETRKLREEIKELKQQKGG